MTMNWRAVVLGAVAAGAVACGKSSSGGGAGPYINAQVIAVPAALASVVNSVSVTICPDASCGSVISTATVTVNGTPVAWNPSGNQYLGSQTIAPGQPVTFSVSYGGKNYGATATQFVAPTLTAPSSPATWVDTVANTFSWSGGSPTTGAEYVAGVFDSTGTLAYPASSSGAPMELPVSTTSLTVPVGALSPGTYQLLAGVGTAGLV